MNHVQLMCSLASEMGVSVDEFRGWSRSKSIAEARAVAMATVREHTRLSYPQIAKLFNRGDHTTVMSAVKRAVIYRDRHPELAAQAVRAVEKCLERRTA